MAKAAVYTTDYLTDGTMCVLASDPVLNEAWKAHYGYDDIDYAFTWGYGPREAAWMLEDIRQMVVGDMVKQGVPVPEDYREYIGRYKPPRFPRLMRIYWQLTFPLRRLPYALRDAAERRALRRMAR